MSRFSSRGSGRSSESKKISHNGKNENLETPVIHDDKHLRDELLLQAAEKFRIKDKRHHDGLELSANSPDYSFEESMLDAKQAVDEARRASLKAQRAVDVANEILRGMEDGYKHDISKAHEELKDMYDELKTFNKFL